MEFQSICALVKRKPFDREINAPRDSMSDTEVNKWQLVIGFEQSNLKKKNLC